jgi:hypothetical protein
MLAVEAPDGFRWNSGWQSAYELLLSGENSWRQDCKLDSKIFERVKSVPVKARISVAITVFRDHDVRQIVAGAGEFSVPNVGRCRVDQKYLGFIQCRSPLVKPSTLLVRADTAASTCPPPPSDNDEESAATNTTAYAWERNGDSGPAEYGISPVESFQLYLSNRDGGRGASVRICPGTPLSISFPIPVEHARAEFEVNGLKLDDYRRENFLLGNFSIGVRAGGRGRRR